MPRCRQLEAIVVSNPTHRDTPRSAHRLRETRSMIQLTVNGVARQFDGDPQMPLLWYLRDRLQLTGSKYGCGIGLCGACTVHLNGDATRSCVTPMSGAAGATVVTIEGLSEHGDHKLQKAWEAGNVPQCGYCQSGRA